MFAQCIAEQTNQLTAARGGNAAPCEKGVVRFRNSVVDFSRGCSRGCSNTAAINRAVHCKVAAINAAAQLFEKHFRIVRQFHHYPQSLFCIPIAHGKAQS